MSINFSDARNLTMLVDFYEITMGNGYFESGLADEIGVFDMFFRKVPDNGGFALFAGLEQLVDYLRNLSFSEEDIAFLRSKKLFTEAFLDYLRHFRFACDVWAVREGTPIFPYEPVVVVRGPVIQAQMIETMVLLTVNFQSLVATKANRIVRAAEGRSIFEFGSRRAQSYDAAILGARASYIGGCDGTACAIADREYSIPALGTMAHSWVQMFDSEYEAFVRYATLYPHACTLLVDTYNVLHSGMPNAIRAFDEVLKPLGVRPSGVRIDSGDIAYLSKKMRRMLDDAGYPDVKIVASNSLDEVIIRDLLIQGACVDIFGVGENLITSKSDPVFGGVYKLVARERDGVAVPKIKISETREKITTPHLKKLYRLYNKSTGRAVADYITMFDEPPVQGDSLVIFDPIETWKRKRCENVELRSMLEPIFVGGQCVAQPVALNDIRTYCREQVETLWEEVTRFENPHNYYVDLSEKLWSEKQRLLEEHAQF